MWKLYEPKSGDVTSAGSLLFVVGRWIWWRRSFPQVSLRIGRFPARKDRS